jgi:hypothetical protein
MTPKQQTTPKREGEWTPGPLTVVASGCEQVNGFLAIARDFGDGVTSVPTAYVARPEDAQLYAAAPTMAKALEQILCCHDGNQPIGLQMGDLDYARSTIREIHRIARAAILRATGGGQP